MSVAAAGRMGLRTVDLNADMGEGFGDHRIGAVAMARRVKAALVDNGTLALAPFAPAAAFAEVG